MKPIKFNQFVISLITVGFIILIAYFFTQVHLLEQHAVDGGLVLSKKIIYPDNFSPLKDYFFGAWTSIHQIAALLFKLDWSVLSVSKFFVFIIAIFYLLGTMYVLQSCTKSTVMALFISIIILIFQKNFGDTDYPTLFFTPHTFGALSLALTTCIFGFVFLGNLFWVGFLSILLINVHPINGIWTSSMIFASIIFVKLILKEKLNLGTWFYGIALGTLITAVSFYFYYSQSYYSSSLVDTEALNNYFKYWEGHRTMTKEYHLEYFLKTLLLFILGVFSLLKLQSLKKSIRMGILTVLISIFSSTIIYFVYKIFHNNIDFPFWFIQIMPTRFTIMHSVIGWPIILGIVFMLIKEYGKERKSFQYLAPITIIFIASLYTIQHNKTLFSIKNSYIKNVNYQKTLFKKNHFWETIKNAEFKGYILTSGSSSTITFRKSLKPILLNPESIDAPPYFPKTAARLAVIIEEIYGISFSDPPLELRNRAAINDDFIKLSFEKYSKEKWQYLSDKFKIDAIVIPVNWNISLVPLAKNDRFAFYVI